MFAALHKRTLSPILELSSHNGFSQGQPNKVKVVARPGKCVLTHHFAEFQLHAELLMHLFSLSLSPMARAESIGRSANFSHPIPFPLLIC